VCKNFVGVGEFPQLTPKFCPDGSRNRQGYKPGECCVSLKITHFNTKIPTNFLHTHYYGTQAMIIWDSLSSHLSARRHFEREHPDWFEFEYFPPYSPELNSVEQCWNMMKNVYMANFVPLSIEHLEEKTFEVAKIIDNDPKLIAEFLNNAKLRL
jgi:transposase